MPSIKSQGEVMPSRRAMLTGGAIGLDGSFGAFALMPGFTYAVTDPDGQARALPAPSRQG